MNTVTRSRLAKDLAYESRLQEQGYVRHFVECRVCGWRDSRIDRARLGAVANAHYRALHGGDAS